MTPQKPPLMTPDQIVRDALKMKPTNLGSLTPEMKEWAQARRDLEARPRAVSLEEARAQAAQGKAMDAKNPSPPMAVRKLGSFSSTPPV